MGKFFKFMLPMILIFGSVLLVIALVAWQKSQNTERKPEAEKAVLVDTIEAEVVSLNFAVNSQGTVRPRTETTLVAEVSGKIVSVAGEFVAGGFFHQGEVLLQIDPSDYETGLKRAEAALASRRAKLADETARSEQALKDSEPVKSTVTVTQSKAVPSTAQGRILFIIKFVKKMVLIIL